MKHTRYIGQRGFTLIELGIVLVIIGLILAAILKGQDVILNARHKDFINEGGRVFNMATFAVLDRQGRLPGANTTNGLITLDPKTDIDGMKFAHPPVSYKVHGSSQFYFFLGSDGARNILIVLPDTGGGTFDKEQVTFLEAFDANFDKTVDGTKGTVIGVNTAPATVSAATWLATYTSTPTAAAWAAGTTKALVYYFDKTL